MSTSFTSPSFHASSQPRAVIKDPAAAVLEARHDARVATDLHVELFSRDFSGSLAARARDLSVGGICLATQSIVALQSLTKLILYAGDQSIEIAIEGRWQNDPTGEASVLSGIEFCIADRETQALLWSLVHDSGKKLAQFIHGQSELSCLSRDDAATVAQASRYREVPRGCAIYDGNDPALSSDSVFVVKRGSVSLTLTAENGRPRELAALQPGGIFGGLPVTAGMSNLDHAAATEDCQLVEVSGSAFAYMRVAQPLTAQRLTQAFSRHHTQRLHRLLQKLI